MKRKLLTRKILIWISVLTGAAMLHLLFFVSEKISDLLNSTVSGYIRFLLSKATGIFPFSVGEIIVFLSVPLAILLSVIAIRKSDSLKSKLIFVLTVIAKAVIVIYSLFVLSFAPGYGASGLDEKLGFERYTPNTYDLYDTLVYVIEQTNYLSDKIEYSDSGASNMPFDLNELSDEISLAYHRVYDTQLQTDTFSTNIKPLIVSPIMTYTHISGMYSFFTGEANLNTNYPDYINVFSTAHEFAHQRGISREDEANFMAYLVCISSKNDYIRYSGYLNMFSYLSEELYLTDIELYKTAVARLSDNAKKELVAYSEFFEKYQTNAASLISDKVNDAYLKSQGTHGSISYSMVVDLAVAYHKTTDLKKD